MGNRSCQALRIFFPFFFLIKEAHLYTPSHTLNASGSLGWAGVGVMEAAALVSAPLNEHRDGGCCTLVLITMKCFGSRAGKDSV